jgi:hypothetical protein
MRINTKGPFYVLVNGLKVPKCSRFSVYHNNASHPHEQFIQRCQNAINYLKLKNTMKNKMPMMKPVTGGSLDLKYLKSRAVIYLQRKYAPTWNR